MGKSRGLMDRFAPFARRWGLAVVWAVLPFTAGPSFADALDPRIRSVQLVASIGLWLAWGAVLAAALVPRATALTGVRIIAPAGVAAAGWAAIVVPDGAALPEALALATTSLAAVVSLSASTGDTFVNGSSYGDERRMFLKAPGALLLGPVELVWALVVAGAVAGPMLLAAHVWALGAAVLVVGWTIAALGALGLSRLAQRWVVFVPAGLVLVDRSTLTDSLLVPRGRMASLGPAPADSSARDLTAGALGLALELRFDRPETITPAAPRRAAAGVDPPRPVEVDAVLFTPTRPGLVLAEARRRRLPVG
jgi:hypothetical protein